MLLCAGAGAPVSLCVAVDDCLGQTVAHQDAGRAGVYREARGHWGVTLPHPSCVSWQVRTSLLLTTWTLSIPLRSGETYKQTKC